MSVRANETFRVSNYITQAVSLVTETGCSYEFPVLHKWWSALKSAVFDSSSSLPPLVSEGGGVVCESVGRADLLSNHFDSMQYMEAVLPSFS